MRRLLAKISLLCLIFVNLLPLPALAASSGSPPREPYEKAAAKSGSWYAEQVAYEGKSNLVIGYKGGYEAQAKKPVLEFKLSEKILLTGVYVPYPGTEAGEVNLTIIDSRGNVYQGFAADRTLTGGLGEIDKSGKSTAPERNTLYTFTLEYGIALPKGAYSLQLNGEKLPVDAYLVKGYNYAAYQRYQEELQEWARGDEGNEESEEVYVDVGNKEISGLYERFVDGGEGEAGPQRQKATRQFAAPAFSLDGEYVIDEIIFGTWNDGQGAKPGVIRILDKSRKTVASYQAQGASQGNVANTLWVARPGISLPAGAYYVDMDASSALDYDEAGEPVFYVGMSAPAVQPANFTGTYKIWLDLYKTRTLMGPVNDKKSSFSLHDYELTVLDKGSVIELIGQYEGMPFSQNCTVLEREENQVTATFNFAADLTKLPYNASIAAKAEVTLKKEPNGRIAISMAGQGFYSRAASKDKGADENTYSLTLRGNRVKKDLPPFVMTAIGKAYGAGNIPGPDSPAQAAAGMLFPPLVGLVVQVLQGLLKPKELASNLSVGEQAMRDANRSLGKGLYTEEEARAWATMADALGASGGDPEDAISVGDNEKPGGADYAAPRESSFAGDDYEEATDDFGEEYGQEDYGYIEPAAPEKVFGSEREQLEAERDEWQANLESSLASADPNDPRSAELHKEYEDYINSLNERIDRLGAAEQAAAQKTMTVQVDHTGRTAEIAYDPLTGTWRNTETGNEFNLETYERDVAPNFAKDKAFVEEQMNKLATRNTAVDRALDDFVAEEKARQQLLGQLQKIRNQSYGVEPPAEGVGDVRANIDKLMNQLSDRNIPLEQIRERAGRVAKVVVDRNTGATLSEEAGKWRTERELSYANTTAIAISEGATDVVTGRTWAGMAGRAALAAATGGASEYVLSPAEALIDIKEGIDRGESGTSATLKAMGKYVIGEVAGEGVGKGLGKAWKSSGIGDSQAVKKVSEWANTPVGEVMDKVMGTGAKTGAKEAVDQAGTRVGKHIIGATDENIGKAAGDAAEYAKYKAGVKDQANIIESKIRNAAPNRPLTPEDVDKALSSDDIRKVLQDPSVSRELKNAHPGVQKAYVEALENKLYKPANEATAKQLQENMIEDLQKEFGPGAKVEVEIKSVRTPDPSGKTSPLNADNDVVGEVTIEVNGKKITREIPAKDVRPIYNKEFAEVSGMMRDGKFDVAKAKAEMPEGITVVDAKGHKQTIGWEEATEQQRIDAFAQKHNQEVTDAFATEAALDFNATRNADGISNVAKLKAGDLDAALADPGGLANMEAYKINRFFNEGGIANQTEAYEQLAKMGKLTDDLTTAYQKLGYPAQDLPAGMQKALDIVKDRNMSPGRRTLELQKLGFQGPQDLANKLSGRIEGLQKLGSPGDTDNPMLSKISSIIISSYLNEKDK